MSVLDINTKLASQKYVCHILSQNQKKETRNYYFTHTHPLGSETTKDVMSRSNESWESLRIG